MEIKEVVTSLEYIKQCIGDEGIAGRTAGEAIDKAVKVLKTWRPPDDTIRRKDAIEAIEKYDCLGYVEEKADILYEAINALPSANTGVIHCKDCKHQVKEWREDKRFKDNGYYACGCDIVGDACGYWALLGQDDDYCSMAERKGNG